MLRRPISARAPGSRTVSKFIAALGLWGVIQGAAEAQWTDHGNALAGTHGEPELTGAGLLLPDTPMTITLSNVVSQSPAFVIVGFSPLDLPFRGGVMVPDPALILNLPTGGDAGQPATLVLEPIVPADLPVGAEFYLQFWIPDASAVEGLAASNAIQGTVQTLYDVIADEVDSRLAEAGSPGSWKKIYSTQDFVNQIYDRKVKTWVAGIDLTGVSPWNQFGGATRAGTLISPRHIAFAQHFALSATPGQNEIVFVTQDEQVVTRSIIAVTNAAGDIGIGLLDSDVPATIGYHKILPRNWQDYLPSVSGLPMLHLDQEEKALVREATLITSNCGHKDPVDPLRESFSEELIGGDSGNPAFFIIGGEAVFVLTHFTSTSGPYYGYYYDQVNTAMATLGGGYQLTEFDFEAFLQQTPE